MRSDANQAVPSLGQLVALIVGAIAAVLLMAIGAGCLIGGAAWALMRVAYG